MLKAFHNSKKVKKKYLDRVSAHIEADEVIKGKYWENGKGCAVGCTIHSGRHIDYESELGIPEWLARVEDTLFEGLPALEAKTWPKRFLSSIKPGADLEKAKRPFLLAICEYVDKDFDHKEFPEVAASIKSIKKLLKSKIASSEHFREAAYTAVHSAAATAAVHSAAHAAAYTAANASYAASYTATTDAVQSATRAAASATRAAYTAANAAKRYSLLSKKLLKILKDCK